MSSCRATNANLTAIETYQGPRGWVQLLAEPIQRGDVPDLAAAIRERRIIDGSSPTPDEARRLVEAHRIAVTAHAQAVALIPDSATAADRSGEAAARTALLRALGVEA